jgi:hypothetical protein
VRFILTINKFQNKMDHFSDGRRVATSGKDPSQAAVCTHWCHRASRSLS